MVSEWQSTDQGWTYLSLQHSRYLCRENLSESDNHLLFCELSKLQYYCTCTIANLEYGFIKSRGPVETTTATLAEENTESSPAIENTEEASPPSVVAAQNENIEVDASFLFHNIFKV
jgi:hypothetical protein